MSNKAEHIEVSFRVDKSGWTKGSVTAVFSGVLHDPNGAPGWNMCYSHDGQHASCDSQWVRDCTRAATPEEYAPLLQELEYIGYAVTPVQRIRWVKA